MAFSKVLIDAVNLIGRIRRGIGAWIVQDYNEVNKKRGVQWSASRLIPDAIPGQLFYSVIEVGADPIDLKQREFAYTGTAVVADIYEAPTYTGGTVDPVFNANGFTTQPPTFGFVLKAGVTVQTEGTKFAPTIYALGPVSRQSKGSNNALYGTNYILKPNTAYLLKFYSDDTQNQDIAVRIEGYEGPLDFYPE